VHFTFSPFQLLWSQLQR